MAKKVKILQANVNRSTGSQDLARALGEKLGCSFICLQEPNKKTASATAANLYASYGIEKNAVIYKCKRSVIPVTVINSESCFVFIQCSLFCLYSVYISPNCSLVSFKTQIEQLFAHVMRTMASAKLPVVICGDFNAKNSIWGGTVTDTRGETLQGAASALGLTALNNGNHPTLVRHNGQSFVDLTFVSQPLVRAAWSVLQDEESLSDHRFILLEFDIGRGQMAAPVTIKIADPEKFMENMKKVADGGGFGDIDRTIGEIVQAHRKSRRTFRADALASMPYWWGDDVEAQIRQTRAIRRNYQRGRNRLEGDSLRLDYVESRRVLNNLIRKKKKEKWKSLCQALEENVFGDAYNIVRAQLKCKGPRIDLSTAEKIQIFRQLFVTDVREHKYIGEAGVTCSQVTDQELMDAVRRIKTGTAPGPDGLSPEHVRTAIEREPQLFRSIYSACLCLGNFPRQWKVSKLVLIQKPTTGNVRKYRPICLLNVMGKVLETIINERLKKEIDRTGGLCENQFGFRSGKSTIDALEKLMEIVNRDRNKIATAIFIDVKNAFNSADWELILRKARRRGVSDGLMRILASYLTDRRVILGQNLEERVAAGVPQGSVLGPTLWNLLYDDVLRSCDGDGVELICYADDLTVVVTADTVDETNSIGNSALAAIKCWMDVNKLEMAPEKTKSVVFSWSVKHRRNVRFTIGDYEITPEKQAKYLGVTIDFNLTFTRHIQAIGDKAERIVKTLNILLANVGGPTMSKRRVLAGALQSAILYAAPIWAGALGIKRNAAKLKTYQRSIALRCCSGYCTVSAEAAVLLATLIPLELLVRERARIRKRQNENLLEDAAEIKRDERDATLNTWQEEGPGIARKMPPGLVAS